MAANGYVSVPNEERSLEVVSNEGSNGESDDADHLHLFADEFLSLLGNAPWENVVRDERDRMILNGETRAQMEHALDVKANGWQDTSVDEPWEINEDLDHTDTYLMIMTAVWLIPKILVFGLPLFLTILPYYLLIACYACHMEVPTDYVRRDTKCFIIVIEILGRVMLFIPRILMVICLFLDYFFYYLFSVPFCLCCSSHGWAGYHESQEAIDPYRKGPGFRWSDIMVCALGQVRRNGPLQCTKCFTGTVLLLPWLKYFVNANPFLYPLKERFVQQISTSLKDCGLHSVHDTARRIISRSIQNEDVAEHEHLWAFIPHYPYPPPDRRWAMGMQHVGKYFQLLTHVTHAVAEAGGSTEQFILSNSVAMPVYRVMLWYDNPYHFFTGFVEASLSTGGLSQGDKEHGGEHPMWLVSGPSPFLSDRDSMTGVGMIDAFFDFWLPTFVDGVRALIRGKTIAVQMHQEVVSKDGISRPAAEMGFQDTGRTSHSSIMSAPSVAIDDVS